MSPIALLVLTVAAPPRATVHDLARAFDELDRVVTSLDPASFRNGAQQQLCDRAAFAALRGDMATATRVLDEANLTWQQPDAAPVDALACSLRVRIEPSPCVVGAESAPKARVSSVYRVGIEGERPGSLELHLTPRDGAAKTVVPLELVKSENGTVTADAHLPTELTAKPATFDLHLPLSTGDSRHIGVWTVFATAPAPRADAIRDALSRLPDRPAVRLARTRAELLPGGHRRGPVESWVFEPATLLDDLEQELGALRRGADPYAEQPGEIWHALPLGDGELPCRIYRNPDGPASARPVVIALHGAGGNEHVFFETQGDGLLLRLADEHDFLAVSPLTYRIASGSRMLPDLIDALDGLYDIDRSRVYIIGHSLGAMTAEALVARHPTEIAAVCAVAGGRPRPAGDGPPIRYYAAELDTIVRMAAPTDDATVDWHLRPDVGHTLVVTDVLAEAVEWLLTAGNTP